MWAKLLGIENTVAVENFGIASYSIVLISNDQNGREGFGYPDVPYTLVNEDLQDFAIGNFVSHSYVNIPFIPDIFS